MALAGLVIASTLPSSPLSKLVKDHGGQFAHMLTSSVTHLITTESDVRASSYKVTKACEHKAILVTEEWLHECAKQKKRVSETPYLINKDDSSTPSSMFRYDVDFVSEAELKENQQREQMEREERRKQALAATTQPPAPQTAQTTTTKPAVGFGFGASTLSGSSASASSSFGSLGSSWASTSSQTNVSSTTTATKSLPSSGGRERRKPWAHSKGLAPKVKAWADADVNRPRFTDDWDVEYFDTLQWTDIKTNHNKYYCLELHIGKDKGHQVVRLYTHYGRTDDLVKNPKAGKRENRFYSTLEQAEDAYAALIEEKTLKKGYRKVELVFSNIGSDKLRVLVSEIAAQKTEEASSKSRTAASSSDSFVDTTPLTPPIEDLVKYIYDEASAALNNTLGPAKITSLGIETPLGVVNMAQIDKGEAILQRLYEMFKLGTHDEDAISELTNQFYTMIPHNLGRQRAQISATRINSMAAFEEKQDLLQLMRDMLNVTAEGKTLGASDIDMKYRALRTKIETLDPTGEAYNDVKMQLLRSHPHGADFNPNANADLFDIKHIYAIHRPSERTAFSQCRIQSNQQTLFHGSRISNYVGLLSRGLMMPKMVVAMGGKRRDGGLLGNGIYFGDSADTSAQYCTPGSKGTRLMLLNNVALGTVKDYEQVVFGLMEPPHGYHSVHGVRNTPSLRTDFKDDEYVIFNPAQQYQQYLVEFTLKRDLDDFVTSQVFHSADGSTSVLLKDGSRSQTPVSSTAAADSSAPESAESKSVSSTVDDIFANLGAPSQPSTTSTTSSRLGGSFKSKYSSYNTTSGNTFTTPFSSMLTTPSAATEALKLQPSTLQVGGILKPSLLQTSTSFGTGNLRLQPSGLDTTSPLASGSLKLQPSGLTTSVKVAPLGSSFGRKSGGQTDPNASQPPNVLQLAPIDTSQSSAASGAAALLAQTSTTDPSMMTDEEKAAKRAAMKMGGKNFASRLATPSPSNATSVSIESQTAPLSNVSSAERTITSTTPYSFEFDGSTTPIGDKAQNTAPTSSETTTRKKKRRDEGPTDASSVDMGSDAYHPHKRTKGRLDDSAGFKSSMQKLSYGSAPTTKSSLLSATSTGFGSTSSWTSSFKTTFSTAPLSSSAKPSLTLSGSSTGTAGFGASFGLSTSALSTSSLSASATSLPPLRTTFTRETTHIKLSALIPKELLKERLAESKIRGLWANDRTNVLLKDHVMLVDMFKKREQMRNTLESEMELNMPKILTRHRLAGPIFDSTVRPPFGAQYDAETQGDYCIVDKDEFKSNLALLTGNIFAGLDMKNVLFVGDLVVGALLRTAEGTHAGTDPNFANLYRSADVEIAIYGLDGEAANKKVSEILFALQSATKSTTEILRTRDEIIILGQFPIRNIRIPIRYFKGPAEAIFARDVDCSCVGFDGQTVWALPRAQRAITKRYNLLDLELQHIGYEANLYSWAKRGFAVAAPGFQCHLVTPYLYQQQPWQVKGLAKLLLFEHEMNNKFMPPTPPGTPPPCEPWTPKHQRFAVYSRDEFSIMRIHEFQEKQKHDCPQEKENIDDVAHHANIFLPWGPQWCTSRVKKHLQYVNAKFYQATNKHLILFGMESLRSGSAPKPAVEELLALDDKSTRSTASLASEGLSMEIQDRVEVCGPLEWKAQSPSEQPSDRSDVEWYRDAYCVEGSAVEVTHAITDLAFGGESRQLGKLLRKLPRGSDVSHISSFVNGRSALSYAALNGDSESISQLISKGADPIAVDAASGLSPIHFAAFSGVASAVETLLRQPSVDINVKSRDQKWTSLHFASYYGNVDALEVLLHDTKIRLNPRDKGGRTPTFVAAYAGNLKCLQMLKSSGAKLDTKAPKEEIGITALQAAAQNGHAQVLSYLVELLKPEFPPLLQPSAEALEEIRLAATPSENRMLHESSETPLDGFRVASPKELAEWSRVDSFGQNMLHYAVKYAEVALVRQIVAKELARHDARFPGVDDIGMPKEVANYNLIDIHAENMYGQNAWYYAQHLLDAFVGGKRLQEGDVAGTIEALGMPSAPQASALRTIVALLKHSGLKPPHLCAHRALPTQEDPILKSTMVARANQAKATIKAIERTRQQRESELLAEELASRPLARSPLKRKSSNDTHGLSSSGRHSPHSSPSLHRPNRGGRQVGPGFPFSLPSSTPTTIAEFASSNDTTQLLVTIAQMHKAKQLTDVARATLKTLTLRKERIVYAALKTFQQDHVSLVFGNTLQLIARTHVPHPR